MRFLAALFAMTGCAAVVDDFDAVWEPATEFPGAEIGPPPSPRSPPPGAVRIASWNIYGAVDPEASAREVLDSPALATADILLVQEVDVYDGEPSRAARLAAALEMTWFYAPERDLGDYTHGQAIFSRYPLVALEVMRLPHADQTIRARDRVGLAAVVELGDGRRLRVVDVHLDTRINPTDRIRQLHPAVVDTIGPTIVGGDLNTLPWTWVASGVPLTGTEAIVGQSQGKILDDFMGALDYASAIEPDQATYMLFGLQLDDLFVRGADIESSGVAGEVEGSDHWPIWVDVHIK